MKYVALILTFLIVPLLNGPATADGKPIKSAPAKSLQVDEVKLWRQDPLLQKLAKKLNPLGEAPGDGALGLNRKFPDKVLVEHQLEGWNWIRAGIATGNGFVVDRGIMAFEWAFARMTTEGANEGAFGESKTVEIANFLGHYARATLLVREAKMDERAKRLEQLIPRLEASLRSPRSLLGEKRWDAAERRDWVTRQRTQAAAAAFWIARLLKNPTLKKTADTWLDEALRRQDASGLFPTAGISSGSKASVRAQIETLETLQGLAWADASYMLKLRDPIAKGFKWLETSKAAIPAPLTYATYAAWTKNRFALQNAQKSLLRK